MLGPEVDQHVLPREVGLRERRIGRVGDAKGYPDGLPPVVQAGSRKLELHGALAHSEWGSLPRSPRRSRSLISAGGSSYAAAIGSPSLQESAPGVGGAARRTRPAPPERPPRGKSLPPRQPSSAGCPLRLPG